MRLYLLRHTEPIGAAGMCYGQTDLPCSPHHDRDAAQRVRQLLPHALLVRSSPLQRCERLAQALCSMQPAWRYTTDPRLLEMHFGAWEGQAWNAIAPQELSDWTADFALYRCGCSGESVSQVLQRVASAVLEAQALGCDQLWVTHAGVIRALQWLTLQSPDALSSWARAAPPQSIRASDWPAGALDWGQVQVCLFPVAGAASGMRWAQMGALADWE